MGRIADATGPTQNPVVFGHGKMRAYIRQVFRCERVWRTFEDGEATDGFGWRTRR